MPRPHSKRRARVELLARRMRAGDPQAREALIVMHLPLARGLALRYRHSNEQVEDLLQVAAVGLVKAVDRWDPDRGLELTTYATPVILGELRHHLRDLTWGIRPPRRLQDTSRAALRERDALWAQLGRRPTVAELASRLDCDEEMAIEALTALACRSLDSLDAPVHGQAGPQAAGDLIASVDRELERAEQRVTLERVTGLLDRDAREIVRLRFEEDLKQKEIASRFGCSQVHISRILRSSLEHLQAHTTGSFPRPASQPG